LQHAYKPPLCLNLKLLLCLPSHRNSIRFHTYKHGRHEKPFLVILSASEESPAAAYDKEILHYVQDDVKTRHGEHSVAIQFFGILITIRHSERQRRIQKSMALSHYLTTGS